MKFSDEEMGKYLVSHITGRMDASTSIEFEKHCDQWLADADYFIAVGMNDIDYISSAGLRSILLSAKKLKLKNGEIRFFGLSGMVADVFKMSGFSTMFKLFGTQEQATSE